MKSCLKKDKREWVDGLAREAEDAAKQGYLKGVHDVTKKLWNDQPQKIEMVKDQTGKLLITEVEIRQRWQEHFSKDLNGPGPVQKADVGDEQYEELDVNEGCSTGQKTRAASNSMNPWGLHAGPPWQLEWTE